MQRFLILLSCFLIITSAVLPQSGENYHLQQFTTDNGLPSNGIKGLQWDEKTEFLWMATEAGIVRFNGVDFKSYTKETMPDIGSERMLFIVRNNAGKMYLSDQPGNIFSIEKSKPVLWKKTNSTASINPDINNYYLLGASDTFFKKYAGLTTHPVLSANFEKIICISDTSLLILSHSTLFYHSISLKSPVKLLVEEGNINFVFKINNNYFINNKKNKTFLLNISNQALTPVVIREPAGTILKPVTSNSLFYWQTGMLNPFFIDGEKAWRLTYDGLTITAVLITTGIPAGSYIKSVQYSEKSKSLFIGTESKGLIVITQNTVESKKRNDLQSKNRNSYYSQIELPDGNILTNESDIIGTNPVDNNALPIKGIFSFNITQTNEHLLWYTQANTKVGYNCLHQYNQISRQTKVFPKIRWGDLVAASGTSIYIANSNGIGILDKDSLLLLHQYPKQLAGVVVFDFTEIAPGSLAVATCAGLFRFNTATKRLDSIFTKENICVRSIWKYKDYVFFGTYGGGFYIYKDGRVRSMPLDKNKYLLYTHCFVPDDSGFCWISTNRGLFKASLNELINVFEKNKLTAYYHYFGKKDGMDMTELNGGCTPCALRLKNKTISFPSMDGLLWVNPEKAIPVLPEGDIFIDDILVDNKIKDPLSFSKQPLPAATSEIIFRLAFSAWCNKENIYLEYQLNDTVNWKPLSPGSESELRFNNLSPGKYTLRIRKLNGFGFDNYTYKTISFTITTPWSRRWWFFGVCALTLFGMIALYLKFRTRQYKLRQRKLEQQVAEKTKELQEQNEVLEKNNTIKTRLISIISHDIVTPLKFVAVAGKNLIEKRNRMPEELQQETIQEMTNTAQELQLLSTNILNWIKYQNENRRMARETFNLHDMVNQVLGILQSLARQKNLVIENRVPPDVKVHQYYEPLKILIYNLLTNAIHFTEKGSITVSGIKEDKSVIMTVKDEGAGMTPEQIQRLMAEDVVITSANVDNKKGHGLGYLIIKDLLKTMGASLQIESKKGVGTSVSVICNETNIA